ncbi:MAG: hypothetical protein RBT30_03410 [Patescibacteria group bacterium]|jgi:hypothetical protein|nr:hypothetical protein [Patescibacteria group bacterium]
MRKLFFLILVIIFFVPLFSQEEDFVFEKIITDLEEGVNVNFDNSPIEEIIELEPTDEEVDMMTEVLVEDSEVDVGAVSINKDSSLNSVNEKIILSVPFIAQAPLGDWSDPRQQDACEEAGVLMAMAWIKDRGDIDPVVAQAEIIALADWQQEKFGEHRDLHIADVATRLFGDYFNYQLVEIKTLNNKFDLIQALKENKIILIPSDGQALANPYFSPPGPERHLLVVTGYNPETDEFITNDPGTRQGRSFVYGADKLFNAIRVYPSGYHEEIVQSDKLGLVVTKDN